MDDEQLYEVTAPGEASWLVDAYQQAVHGAARLRAELIADHHNRPSPGVPPLNPWGDPDVA